MSKKYKITEKLLGNIPTLQSEGDIPLDVFIKIISHYRSTHTKLKSWYQFLGTVNGKAVSLKAFNTYNQILIVDCVKYGGLADLSVTQWKEELRRALE